MSDDRARELQEQGIQAAKSGNKDQALRLLSESARLEPADDTTWLWLASVARNKRERLQCLKKVLQINPDNEMGQKAVRALGIDPEELAPRGSSLEDSLAEEDAGDEGPGVPIPNADAVTESQQQAESVIQTYLAPADMDRIAWEPKTRRRAGERELAVLRMQIAGALAIIAIVAVAVLGYAALSVPEVREVVFGPSPTATVPSATPTNTPTNTPGFDPTASPTPDFTGQPTFTVTPLFDSSITPWPTGFVQQTPRPTDLYLPRAAEVAVRTAVPLIAQGPEGAQTALPLLERERLDTVRRISPNPYYYAAMAFIRMEDYGSARAILDDIQSRLDNQSGVRAEDATRYQPLISVGYAQLNLIEASIQWQEMGGVQPDERGQFDEEEQALLDAIEGIRELTRSARQFDPEFGLAYIIEAQSHQLEGNYEQAQAVYVEARAIPELMANVEVIVARGNMLRDWGYSLVSDVEQPNADQEKFAAASFEGYYATYVDPFTEEAHQLAITAAIESGEIGLAAIRCEDYLLYFPASPDAFRLFGDVRALQESTEFALYNYSQALASDTSDEFQAQVLASRSQVYTRHNRLNLALDDLNQSIALNDVLSVRALRMPVAFALSDYATASDDAETLLDSGLLPNEDIWLMQAQIMIQEAGPGSRRDLARAISTLYQIEQSLLAATMPPEDDPEAAIDPAAQAHLAALMPVVNEYRAMANYKAGNYSNALTAVNRALEAVETGGRHYLRGLIHEALGDEEAALAEYQWVLAWDTVVGYPFAEDAQAQTQGIDEARVAAMVTVEATPEATVEATPEATPEATAEAKATAEVEATEDG